MRVEKIIVKLVTGLVLFSCGGGGGSQKRASSQKQAETAKGESKEEVTKQAPKPTNKTASDGLKFRALEFVPYMLGAERFSGASSLLVEAGYFDVRQSGAEGSVGKLNDYRSATVAAYGGAKITSLTIGPGCTDLQKFSESAVNSVEKAAASGFFEGALTESGNTVSAHGLADSGPYELSAALSIEARLAGKSRMISNKKIPPKGAVSLSKALYTIFGTHLDLSDISASLAANKRELVLTEDSGTAGFNAVVATVYGSAGKFIRCIFGPGESATLTYEQLSPLLPFRALSIVYSNVELVTEEGVSTWVATFGGTALEDLSVP